MAGISATFWYRKVVWLTDYTCLHFHSNMAKIITVLWLTASSTGHSCNRRIFWSFMETMCMQWIKVHCLVEFVLHKQRQRSAGTYISYLTQSVYTCIPVFSYWQNENFKEALNLLEECGYTWKRKKQCPTFDYIFHKCKAVKRFPLICQLCYFIVFGLSSRR